MNESEAQFRQIFSNNMVPMAIWKKSGEIIDANDALLDLIGYTRIELENGMIRWDELTPKDFHERDLQAIAEVNVKGFCKPYEKFYRHKDGHLINIIIGCGTFDDKADLGVLFIIDITERKKAEEALRKSENSLTEAMRIGRVGRWELNIQTGELSWSKELYNIYGVEPKNFTYNIESFAKLVHPDDQEKINDIINQVSNGSSLEFDFRLVTENGLTYVVKTIAEVTEYDEEGNPLLATGLVQDITKSRKDKEKIQTMLENEQQLTMELKTANEELKYVHNELKESINKLEVSNKELEQFAYVASHDLQEPLRMVGSFTQLLEMHYKDKLDDEANEYINFVVDGAKRMKELIDDLLAFSRVTSNNEEFKVVNLDKVINDVLFNMEIVIEENDAHIHIKHLPVVFGDYSQMVQVFQNLIGNAIKYRRKEAPHINISVDRESKQWLFAVKDNGIGIESDYCDKIFDLFKRLHTKDEYEGTGIGLAITQKIIKRHGGKIWVESDYNNGSTFYFTIPIVEIR